MHYPDQMSHRRGAAGPSGRPKSRTGSAVVQFEESESNPVCGVSECWSPNSEENGILIPPGSRGSNRRTQRLTNPSRSRPMGGIEKVIEYRALPNSGGSVELRRVTPSADGPVEHIDVVEPVHMHDMPRGKNVGETSRTSSRASPRKWRSSLRDKSASNRRPSSSASTAGRGMTTSTPWLDFEGPPAQQHAAIWNNGNGNGAYGMTGHRRLAMNGSQPCLMVMSADPASLHHQGGPAFHHYYHHHLHPSVDMSGYDADYMQAPMFHDRAQLPEVHGSFVGHQHAARLAGSQPCLFMGTDPNQTFVQAPVQSESQPRRKSSCRSAQKLSEDQRTRLKRSESFSVPATWGVLPPPPPPVPGHFGREEVQLATPSLSPLAVVRNKRANQANWEREARQRRLSAAGPGTPDGEGSSVDSILSCAGPPKAALAFGSNLISTPLLRSGSCTRIFPDSSEEEVATADEDQLPPPPSPPCTCGKNLELPPTPPQGHRRHHHHHHHRHHHPRGSHTEVNTGGGLVSSKTSGTGSTAYLMEEMDGDGVHNHQLGHHHTLTMNKEKEVSFANCKNGLTSSSSPPTPSRAGYLYPPDEFHHTTIQNNEAYPCDCCRLEDQYYPNPPLTHSQRRHQAEDLPHPTNGVCKNGIGHGVPILEGPTKYGIGGGSLKSPKLFRAKIVETERGVSLEFGKFVALISFSGVRFRRQHWCLLSVILLIIVLSVAIGLPLSGDDLPLTAEERAVVVKQLLKEVPLIDGHNDLPWNIRKFIHNKLHLVNLTTDLRMVKPWSDSIWSHTDLHRMTQGNLGGQFWVAYAPCGSQHKDAVQVTLEQIDLIKRFIGQYPKLQFVNDSAGLMEAHAENRIASLISVESGHSIGTSLAVLRMFHRLGAVSLTLTHNCNTPWADCSNVDKPGGIPEHNGLSKFGKTVIKELNRLGMIIDLSHSSHATSMDTIQTSEAPVIFSHSSAYGICNSTRNVKDDALKLLAKKNGLVMVNFFSYFLTCSNKSSINDVVAHLNYIRKVAGVDHVGIGASYDGINAVPAGLEDVSKYPELFASLLASGMWTIEDLKKLAGLNFIRVFKEVERVSQMLSTSIPPLDDDSSTPPSGLSEVA